MNHSYVLTAAEMRAMDRTTIEDIGIPGIVLMEQAGRTVADAIVSRFPQACRGTVLVLCGPGNNGGDGFVVARILALRGIQVHCLLAVSADKLRGDAEINFRIARNLNLPVSELFEETISTQTDTALQGADLVVDALLGTGTHGPLRGRIKSVVAALGHYGGPIVAVDIPTGVDADTGTVHEIAVSATHTVTMGLPKRGLYLFPGMDYVGTLSVADIGIPPSVMAQHPASVRLYGPKDMPPSCWNRQLSAHKGRFGHLLILAGSPGLTGAAALAGLGALRVGTGLVTLGLPRSLNAIMEAKVTEAMTLPLPETPEGTLADTAYEPVLEFVQHCSAVALGPGLSRNADTAVLIRRLVQDIAVPLVLDADGLNAFQGRADLLAARTAPTILTPHPGEFARLTGSTTSAVQADRIKAARNLQKQTGHTVLLKGACSLVAGSNDHTLWIIRTGNPGMASGGTGDVLTGVLGGLLAQHWSSNEAATAGACIHGLAGDLAANLLSQPGMIAGDLVEQIPHVLRRLANGDYRTSEAAD